MSTVHINLLGRNPYEPPDTGKIRMAPYLQMNNSSSYITYYFSVNDDTKTYIRRVGDVCFLSLNLKAKAKYSFKGAETSAPEYYITQYNLNYCDGLFNATNVTYYNNPFTVGWWSWSSYTQLKALCIKDYTFNEGDILTILSKTYSWNNFPNPQKYAINYGGTFFKDKLLKV